jgi:hypothetical protein
LQITGLGKQIQTQSSWQQDITPFKGKHDLITKRQASKRVQNQLRSNFTSLITENLPLISTSKANGISTIDLDSKPRRTKNGQSKSVNKMSKMENLNSIFGTITNKTTAQDSQFEGTVKDSGSMTMSGATPYPNYFFKPEENLFSPIK